MTPQEKAQELHSKFFNCNLVDEEAEPMQRVTFLHAKASAIIAVKEIIEVLTNGD